MRIIGEMVEIEDNWNKFLMTTEEGNIFQSAEWAEVLTKIGEDPYAIMATDSKGSIVGTLLLSKRARTHYEWYFGPIIKRDLDVQVIFGKIMDVINEIADNDKIFSIDPAYPPVERDMEVHFNDYGFASFPACTFLIDLNQSSERLWKNVSKKGRYAVRKGKKQGISVEEIEYRGDLKEYFKIYNDARRRESLPLKSFDLFESIWDILRPKNMAKIFVAKYEGRIIAGITVLIFNKRIREFNVADTEESRNLRLYSNDLLKWHVIEWGAHEGYKIFDLAGVECDPKEGSKGYNIFRFKKKWGGKLTRYHYYIKSYSKFRRVLRGILTKV